MWNIEIEYCAEWHYTPRAVRMTEELLTEFETNIASWKLIPSRGGVFEFSLNGELLFSKKKLGRHAEIDEIRKLLKAKLNGTAPNFKLQWQCAYSFVGQIPVDEELVFSKKNLGRHAEIDEVRKLLKARPK